MSRDFDIAELTRPDGIVPVNAETVAGLVREVLRLRAALDANPRPKHPQHLAWEALYPHFGERADFIVSLIAHLLPSPPYVPNAMTVAALEELELGGGEVCPGLAEAGETTGGWDAANASSQEGRK